MNQVRWAIYWPTHEPGKVGNILAKEGNILAKA
jgi:hypothetical protein